MSNDNAEGSSQDQQNHAPFDMAGLGAALSAGGSAGGHEVLDSVKNLADKCSKFLEGLPPSVRKRVLTLRQLQTEHDEFKAKFYEERAVLEAKYQKLYEPLYTKRYEIVNGILDVESNTEEKHTARDEGDKQEEKGVPQFWLTALKTNDITADQITERDEGALKYLQDIKYSKIADPKGFKIDFYFNPNPYFKNEVLTKTYHMGDDDDEPILERAIGTEINWYPEKNLTQKLVKKKPKRGNKTGRPLTRLENCTSFFNFFKPPRIPEDDEDLDEDAAEHLQDVMEQDYDVGSTIRDKIIPHAVSWFTGEACETEDFQQDDEDDEEDDEDEDEDEDEEVDEEDEDVVDIPRKGRGVSQRTGDAGEQPSECKQQ